MERAIRYSKKREAILQALHDTDYHPSAEWLYQSLKASHPDLSLGTVYRNLVFFQKQGTVKSVGVVDGQERFDATVHPHTHFVCSGCGAVMDLHKLKLSDELDRTVCEQYGLAVERHELTFYGICQKCMQNKKYDQEEIKV